MPGAMHNALSSSSSNGSPDDIEVSTRHLRIEDEYGGVSDDGVPNPYPHRPGEPNCKFYMRTGSCSYGNKCKYNHPILTEQERQHRDDLPQRDGHPDCQFFLKTGTCKYGANCRYHHPHGKRQLFQLNALGLPMRKDAKSCPYFMKTGSCKFSLACKFNHPQPVNVGTIFPASGAASVYEYIGYSAATSGPYLIDGVSTWPPSWATYMTNPLMQGFPSYMPLTFPPKQAPIPKQQGSSADMVKQGNIGVSSTCALGSDHTSSNHQAEPGSSTVTFPERPDQPECQYYMKTGRCKYGSSCKYHHPKERNQLTDCTIGPFGLPLRPGWPTCSFYAIYGNCKYGTACKYDHPVVAVFALPEPSAPFSSQNGSGHTSMTSENSSFRISSAANELKTPLRIHEPRNGNDKEDENASSQTSPTHAAPHSESSCFKSQNKLRKALVMQAVWDSKGELNITISDMSLMRFDAATWGSETCKLAASDPA